jgi:hypothetical protein
MPKVEIHCECHANTALMRNLLIHWQHQDDRIAEIWKDNQSRLQDCQSGMCTGVLLKRLENKPLPQISSQQKGKKKDSVSKKRISQYVDVIKVVFCDLDDNIILPNGKLKLKNNANKYVSEHFILHQSLPLENSGLYLFREETTANRLIYIQPAIERLITDLAFFYGKAHQEWGFPESFKEIKDFCKNIQNKPKEQLRLRQAITNLVQAGIAIEETTAFKPLQTLADWLNF